MTRPRTVVVAVAVVTAAAGAVVAATWPTRAPTRSAPTAPVLSVATVPTDPWCPTPAAAGLAALRQAYARANPSARVLPLRHRLLLVGDSTACTLLQGLDALAPFFGVEVENAAVIGCGVVSDRIAPDLYGGVDINKPSSTCHDKAMTVEQSGLVHGRPDIVLWSSAWEKDPLLVTSGGRSTVEPTGSAAWTATLDTRVAERLTTFRRAGAKVVLLEQPPFVDLGKVTGITTDDRQFEAMNALLGRIAWSWRSRAVAEVDLADRICPGGPPCTILVSGVWVRGDGEHYSGAGAVWAVEWLLPRAPRAAS